MGVAMKERKQEAELPPLPQEHCLAPSGPEAVAPPACAAGNAGSAYWEMGSLQ